MFGRMRSSRSRLSGVETPTSGRLLGATTLVANNVYDADGKLVGKLEEIIIDTKTGCVRHAVLAIGGVMGFGSRRFAVPWSTLSADPDYRRCVVDVTQMQFTAVQVPEGDPWLQRTDSTLLDDIGRARRPLGTKS